MRQIDAIKIFKRKHCLIIDDMSEVRGGLKRMLTTFGIDSIDTAATSEQAIELSQEKNYDLVLCDYNLGDGQDGQQVLEEMRYRRILKNTSLFLMITAETSRDMVLGALEYLPDDYLTKPITQELLKTRLNRIVMRHEDLLPIKAAIDESDYEKAIAQCQAKLDANGRYRSSYLRIQAELLYRSEQYEPAQEIYLQSLEEGNSVWAQLGLGKTYLAQKRYIEAEKRFNQVIEHDSRFVEAHDLLGELYASQADYPAALESMKNAAEVSPKSVLRQRKLASMALVNKDRQACIKARRRALSVGEHSCYYSPQDYFDLTSQLMEADDGDDVNQQVKNAKDAEMYIRRAEKKHPDDKGIKMQAMAARSRVANYRRKVDEAKALLNKAKDLNQTDTKAPYAQLELAQAMTNNGDSEGAAKLIKQVARENPDSSDLADRADALSDEPVSKKGRKMAAELTQKGIKLYEKKSFDESIDVFKRAIALFPNHIGLRLNIAQVVLMKAKADGADSTLSELCQSNLEAIGSLEETNAQYARQQLLLSQSLKMFSAHNPV